VAKSLVPVVEARRGRISRDLRDRPARADSRRHPREAPQARRERAYIARLVRSCRSQDEIKAALVDEFGDSVLALPSKDGFNLSAHVAPLFAMLLAGAAIVVALARWRRAGANASGRRAALGSPGLLDPTDVMRLDEELRREER
jgi:cytochrome c-type biogenesis protein CcmH/NrfF